MSIRILAVCLIVTVPLDVLAKCKIKYDEDGIASSRYWTVRTWASGSSMRFSKYGQNYYLLDARFDKGVLPWRKAEFAGDSWIVLRFQDDEITLHPLDFQSAVRRVVVSMPWDTVTESRYELSREQLVRLSSSALTEIEVNLIGPDDEPHQTVFEMKARSVKAVQLQADCILAAQPRTVELPSDTIVEPIESHDD